MKIIYNAEQVSLAAEFISKHNPNNFSIIDVRNAIYNVMRRMKFELIQTSYIGPISTMGFMIHPYHEEDNCWVFEVLVDPVLGKNDYSGDFIVEL